MWQILFILIFISISIFIIFPFFKNRSNISKKPNFSKHNGHEYESLENEYNLGLIDREQFDKEKEKINHSNVRDK